MGENSWVGKEFWTCFIQTPELEKKFVSFTGISKKFEKNFKKFLSLKIVEPEKCFGPKNFKQISE